MLNDNAKALMTTVTSVAGSVNQLKSLLATAITQSSGLGATETTRQLQELSTDLDKHVADINLVAKTYQDANNIE